MVSLIQDRTGLRRWLKQSKYWPRRKTMVQYSILKQIKSGKLILWDGPSLRRQAADRVIKIRRTDNPKEKFFVYKEDRNVE